MRARRSVTPGGKIYDAMACVSPRMVNYALTVSFYPVCYRQSVHFTNVSFPVDIIDVALKFNLAAPKKYINHILLFIIDLYTTQSHSRVSEKI